MDKAKTIKLQAGHETLCFLIHGYSGCPQDFNALPEYLHQQNSVDVHVPLLRNHGKNIDALDELDIEDVISDLEKMLKKDLKHYSEVILGGISWGAQLALYLASRHPIQAAFNVCLPYPLRFPFNIPGINHLEHLKKHWVKRLTEEEGKLRGSHFYCPKIHIKGISIIKKTQALRKEIQKNMTCPLLSIHSTKDPIGSYRGIEQLELEMERSHKKIFFQEKNHNLFFTQHREVVYQKIQEFIEQNCTKIPTLKPKIAALIPAYNEAGKIGGVLKVLKKVKYLDEIIVIDDGSVDETATIARNHTGIKVIRFNKNQGKASALQKGIESTDASLFFFCDADLNHLTSDMVKKMIEPVLQGHYEMFIGLRNNRLQKAIHLFALNSGERALTRELWDKVPGRFKQRYRIEAGLNFVAQRSARGYGWQRFDYTQTLKEKKYGFVKGTLLRWWMNGDVAWAYCLSFASKVSSLFTKDQIATR